MELVEKVKLGYQIHCNSKCSEECPYYPSLLCVDNLIRDSESLIKAYKVGKWIEYTYKDDKTKAVVLTAWRCSNCQHFHDKKDKYCPNCGAKMEGVEYNNDEG